MSARGVPQNMVDCLWHGAFFLFERDDEASCLGPSNQICAAPIFNSWLRFTAPERALGRSGVAFPEASIDMAVTRGGHVTILTNTHRPTPPPATKWRVATRSSLRDFPKALKRI